MTRILYILLLFSIRITCFSQDAGKTFSKKELYTIATEQYRQSFSADTKNILIQLDSLLMIDSTLEFRTVGEASELSIKFQKYGQLVKTASETELLGILNCKSEHPALRGYAYMAYAFKCFAAKKKEKLLNYNFSLNTLKGCLGFTMDFSRFKSYCKERNGFDPNPHKTIIDPEETQTIKEENKIRQEQGIPKRKE